MAAPPTNAMTDLIGMLSAAAPSCLSTSVTCQGKSEAGDCEKIQVRTLHSEARVDEMNLPYHVQKEFVVRRGGWSSAHDSSWSSETLNALGIGMHRMSARRIRL